MSDRRHRLRSGQHALAKAGDEYLRNSDNDDETETQRPPKQDQERRSADNDSDSDDSDYGYDEAENGGLRRWLRANLLLISGVVVLATVAIHAVYPSPYTARMLHVSHPLYVKDVFGYEVYRRGIHDLYFFLYRIFLVAFLREGVGRFLVAPLGKLHGIKRDAKLAKFIQEGVSVVYYTWSWTVGLICLSRSTIQFGTPHFWAGYPHMIYDSLFKTYIITQLAHWVNDALSVSLLPKRKDDVAMVLHHISTISLIAGCYVTNYTNVGLAVFLVMDVTDIFLSAAKCCKYMGYRLLPDILFGVFLVSWLVFRVYAYTYLILYRSILEMPHYLRMLSETDWSDEKYDSVAIVCTWGAFLATLQILIWVWTWLIWKIVRRVLAGKGAADIREKSTNIEDFAQGKKTKKA